MTPQETREKVAIKNRRKFDELPQNLRDMYGLAECQLCGKRITKKQLNINIEKGQPQICQTCNDNFKYRINDLAHLLDQLSLF